MSEAIRRNRKSHLRAEIEKAINTHCAEDGSDTPDFILAQYLMDVLAAFDGATDAREKFYGRPVRPCQEENETGAQ